VSARESRFLGILTGTDGDGFAVAACSRWTRRIWKTPHRRGRLVLSFDLAVHSTESYLLDF
jgi:hypothetical protein